MEEAAARRGVVGARRMEFVRRPEGPPPFGARGARARGVPGDRGGRRVIEVTEVHAEWRIRTRWYRTCPQRRGGRETRQDHHDRHGRCPEPRPTYGVPG